MRALTASFLFDFKSNMQAISERSYQNKLKNLHYQKFTKTRSSGSEREIFAWLLSTARLQRNGQGGNIQYDTLAQVKQTYTMGNFAAGTKISKNQLTDLDGKGVDIGAEWSAQVGADIAYFPQREVITQLLNGETGLCYDGKAFFATDHPVNPSIPGSTTYSNLFTDLPIDSASTTLDVALDNLNIGLARISAIKMPNGVDPRFLTVKLIMGPPALRARLQQLTHAKFLGQASNGAGGGTGDVERVIQDQAFGEPVVMAELAASQSYPLGENGTGSTVSGDDESFYVFCQESDQSELGAMVWINREPVTIQTFTGEGGQNVELARAREIEMQAQGRAVAGFGLPFYAFKFKN